MVAEKYPVCNKCWTEWKEYRVMVINEMRLDMSMSDHRKLLKKHEKIFAGVLTPEGDIVDYSMRTIGIPTSRRAPRCPDAFWHCPALPAVSFSAYPPGAG